MQAAVTRSSMPVLSKNRVTAWFLRKKRLLTRSSLIRSISFMITVILSKKPWQQANRWILSITLSLSLRDVFPNNRIYFTQAFRSGLSAYFFEFLFHPRLRPQITIIDSISAYSILLRHHIRRHSVKLCPDQNIITHRIFPPKHFKGKFPVCLVL